MTSTSPRSDAPSVATVGGYRLLTQIGEGGMGVVHLAKGPDGQRAALKVLRPHVVGDQESRRRLAQEVESLQHVRSDNVAEILDADPWGEIPFVVTRFVPGHSLHAAVEQQGPLPPDDLEHAARGLLRAVRDVHAAHVLHRDIKPTNVVMEGRSPILIDFGLARLAEDPRLTATGWLMGTPGYLAPEVLLGSPATTASDVHGWAATLVYAATGRSPYGRGHVMTVLDRTRRGEIDLTGVPGPLGPLLAAALALEPHQRPTVPEALDALDHLGAGPATVPWPAAAPPHPRTRPVTVVPPIARPTAPATRPYTVVAPAQRPAQQPAPQPAHELAPSGATAYPSFALLPPERLSGWGRFRLTLALLALAGVVVTVFGAAPYVAAVLSAVGVLLARGASHSRQATARRRSLRGRRWFDGPTALVSYPWHVLRGLLGSAAVVLFSSACTATTAGVLLLGGGRPDQALLVGGVVLAFTTWWGPGSARVRGPVARAGTAVSRYPGVWGVAMAGVLVLATAWWWSVSDQGIHWDPASGPPTDTLWHLADRLGLRDGAL